MEWLLVAVLAKGIVETDLTYSSAVQCYENAAKASAASRGVLAKMADEKKQDVAITQYACVLMDN